ncbi:hypothetical protein ACNQFZ_11330 [Schinkia sp. CFF1]
MNNLNQISNIYQNFTLVKPKIELINIKDDLFKSLFNLHKLWLLEMGLEVEHRLPSLLNYDLKVLEYQLSTIPLSYDQILSDNQLINIINAIQKLIKIYPNYAQLLNNIQQTLEELASCTTSALFEAVADSLKYTSFTYAIVSLRPFSKEHVTLLKQKFQNNTLSFFTEKDYRTTLEVFDYAIFLGSAGIFPESHLYSINSKKIVFISRDCYLNNVKKYNNFYEWEEKFSNIYIPELEKREFNFSKNIDTTMKFINDITIDEKIDMSLPNLSENIVEDFTLRLKSNTTEKELISSKLFTLDGNDLIFIKDSSHKKLDIVNSNGEFKKIPVNEVQVGDYIVISDFNTPVGLRNFADSLFKKNGILNDRKRQDNLRKYIHNNIEKFTLSGYCNYLRQQGLTKLEDYQILNLSKEDAFKLQDNSLYLGFLLIATKGDEAKAHRFFKSSKRLNNFHIQAGRKIRKIMRQILSDTNILDNLENSDYHIVIPELPELEIAIRLIKSIAKQSFNIPSNKVNVILSFNDY